MPFVKSLKSWGFKCLGYEEEKGEVTLVWCEIGKIHVAETIWHPQKALFQAKFKSD